MRALFALPVTIFVTQIAVAQPVVTIPDTVITATRTPTPVTDIPAGVTVIDRQAIDASGATTLGDVLATVPGLHVSPSGGPGGQSSVFLRGTNSGHVLVLRDGMPINDGSDQSDAFNFGIDTLSDIERIEVVRGPMAALYGSGAIGGVINLISRRGTTGAPLLQMDLSGGYPATIQGSAQASGVTGPFDYALTLESQSHRGFDSTPQRMTNIYTGTPQGFRDRIATANLGYTPIEGTRLSLFLRGSETLFGFNTLGSPTFDDSNSFGTVSSVLGRIGVTSKLFNGVYETGVFLGRLQDDRRYLEQLDLADPNLQAVDDRYHAYRTDFQWNNTVHLNDLLPSTVLTSSDLTFGYEHTVDTINVRVNESFAGFPFTQSARASMTTDAAYTGVTTTIWKRLIVTGQVRQDWVFDNAPTTWRLGSVLLAPEIGTSFKAAYGTSFRAPSLFELYGVDSSGTVGNPALKPETAQGWEVGWTTTVPVLGHADAVTFGATYFNEQVNDLIIGVFTPIVTSVNVGSAHIQGVETEFTVRPATWLMLHVSYTFTDAISDDQPTSEGSELLRRPRNAASADVTVMPIPHLRIVSTVIYTGPSHDFLYDNQDNAIGYGVGQHGIVANMTVAYDVTPKVQVHLDGTNIFNSRFEPVNGYQMPGAAVVAGVRLRW
ncbi:MAG: TonB-dependent receptor [Acetobacteraceae bacterium]